METNVNVMNGKYKKDFELNKETIGTGSFGVVVRVKHKSDGISYAIKRIIIKNKKEFDRKLGEVKVLSESDHANIISYKSAWIEEYEATEKDSLFEKRFTQIKNEFESNSESKKELHLSYFAVLHIQMDLCWFPLSAAILELKDFFQIQEKQRLPKIAYYMSSEILIEILEGINYLHTVPPPKLHRDLKPENILIKGGPNAKFIKIADFGLAVVHNEPELSHTQMSGTIKYMAPEVKRSRKYDLKADMYSIGVVIQELFNIDINVKEHGEMTPEYIRLIDMTGDIMSGDRKDRPTCAQIINNRKEWAVDYKEVRKEIIKEINVNQSYDRINQFIQYFLQTKYKFEENL